MISTQAHCPECSADRRVSGYLGPRDGMRYLTLATCGHVVANPHFGK